MHKSDRIEAGCTVEDEPYKSLERDAEKSILAGPLRFPPGQLPFSASLKAPVPLTHDAVTVPVMFGPNITGYLSKSDFSNDTSYTGVFSQTERGSAWSGGSSGHENTWDSPYFSARAANSTYGSSSVVQPASIRLMLCIKI